MYEIKTLVSRRFFYLLLCLSFLSQPGLAVAQSRSIYESLQTPFYDPSSSLLACSNLSDGSVGSENEETAFNFFLLRKNLSPQAAAAIVSNLIAESGLNPRVNSNIDGGELEITDRPIAAGRAWGIAQWLDSNPPEPGRQTALLNRANEAREEPSEFGVQLELGVWYELNNGYKDVLDNLNSPATMESMVEFFVRRYEAPSEEEIQKSIGFRQSKALDLFSKYGSNSGSFVNSDSTACSEDASGEVVGNFSLPVAKKWYLSNKQWFTKPHHDYPAADIPVPDKSPVFSMTDGKIISAPVGGSCGNGIIVETADGIQFLYCHGSDGGSVAGAKNGDTVKAGQLIMHSGYTGTVEPQGLGGSHLHLQIKIGKQSYCPQTLFTGIVEGSVPDIRSLPIKGCTYERNRQ